MDLEKERNSIIKEIDELQSVTQLMEHPGWKYIEKYFNDSINLVKDRILLEKDSNEVIRLQERFKAYSAIPQILKNLLILKDKRLEDLKEYDEVHNFNTSYGLS